MQNHFNFSNCYKYKRCYYSYLSNSFSDIYNVELDNELFNIADLKQQIGYASSKSWDNALIEPTHIASIGNIMYTSYSMWLIV